MTSLLSRRYVVPEPSAIQSPLGHERPFEGAFGNPVWEAAAAHLVYLSQSAGKWVGAVKLRQTYDANDMMGAGLLFLEETGWQLTGEAIRKLREKYPV